MEIGRSCKRLKVGDSYSKSYSIDKDSIEEILSKLPVKSLLKFACVSQEWCALTKNAHFIAHHLSFSNPKLYLFLTKSLSENKTAAENSHPYESTSTGGGIPFGITLFDRESKFKRLEYLSFLKNKSLRRIYFVASSSGLVCFFATYLEEIMNGGTKLKDSIIVCNPATNQFRPLPIPTPFRDEKYDDWPLLGFEYLHDIKEYKLVSIFPESITEDELVTFQVQVLTQSSNSWRQLNCVGNFPCSYVDDCFTFNSLTLNGVLYWLVLEAKSNKLFVLSFDLHQEVFMSGTPLPEMPTTVDELWNFRDPPPFLIWKDSPALILPSTEKCYQSLWVMTKSNGTKPASWTQQLRIKNSSKTDGPLMGILNDQILIRTAMNDGCLVLYDPVREETRELVGDEATRQYRYHHAIRYVESLLSV